jgi:Cu(I)/Ag(I) efflux system membrane protein CusA/SilA
MKVATGDPRTASNRDVGGRVVEMAEPSTWCAARLPAAASRRPRNIVLKATSRHAGADPGRHGDGSSSGPDERRGLTELNGEGEVVSGIALASASAQNALERHR